MPVETAIASEFRYADPLVDEDTVVLAISQSGETADTLAAMEEARSKGCDPLVERERDRLTGHADRGWVHLHAGGGRRSAWRRPKPSPRPWWICICWRSTWQTCAGVIGAERRYQLVSDLMGVPALAGECLDREKDVLALAQKFKSTTHMLYLGRGINMPIAYEGALKLKEISYIHAEGYPAGEMKHGPIALIDRTMPVVALSPDDPWYDKMISQIEQALARGGEVIAVATDGDERIPDLTENILWVPKTPWLLSPVVTSIPLQLFAYHIASLLGLDVDQPRNLAKSVTVE